MSGGLLFSMSFFLFIWLEVRTHSLSKNFIEWSWWPGMGHTSKRVKLPVSHKKAEYARGCILIFYYSYNTGYKLYIPPCPGRLLALSYPWTYRHLWSVLHITYPVSATLIRRTDRIRALCFTAAKSVALSSKRQVRNLCLHPGASMDQPVRH